MIALVLAATPPEWLTALAVISAVWIAMFLLACLAATVVGAIRGDEDSLRLLVYGSLMVAVIIVIAWGATALSATLTFTLPATTQQRTSGGALVACSGGDSLRTLAGWRIFAQVQAPQWEHHRECMLGHDIYWQIFWPQVREAALPRQVKSASTLNLPRRGAGQRVTVDVPDSLDVDTGYGVFRQPVLCWYVETFNDSLKVSCPSNLRAAR